MAFSYALKVRRNSHFSNSECMNSWSMSPSSSLQWPLPDCWRDCCVLCRRRKKVLWVSCLGAECCAVQNSGLWKGSWAVQRWGRYRSLVILRNRVFHLQSLFLARLKRQIVPVLAFSHGQIVPVIDCPDSKAQIIWQRFKKIILFLRWISWSIMSSIVLFGF